MAIQQRGGLTIYCTHINVAIGVTYRVRWSLMPLFLIYADRTHLGPVELLRCFLYGWRESLRKEKNQKAKGRRRLFIVCSLVYFNESQHDFALRVIGPPHSLILAF